MRYLIAQLLALLVILNSSLTSLSAPPALRPPAVPLVACDPYFSIWSPGDQLHSTDTVHWTGKPHRLASRVWIDGQVFQVIGQAGPTPALTQLSVEVLPTRTIYTFGHPGVELTLTFLTPALPYDIDLLSRPVTYVSYEFRSTDGQPHQVRLDFAASGELAVNLPAQQVQAEVPKLDSQLRGVRLGSPNQPVLVKKGDDLRIDWGYLYLCATGDQKPQFSPPESGPGSNIWLRVAFDDFKVSKAPTSRWFMLAYDDLWSIEYMKKKLRPYWRRNGWEANDLLKASARQYASLKKSCEKFDAELLADLEKAGGYQYARIAALAYRQCFAAGKFVADANGQPLQFSKENHSNGCIATSDVFYPMAPQFLLFGPSLAKSFVVPFMNYAASPRWKFPFAPHDLGTYPKANGQVYGGGERTEEDQMPVEESGNLLILFAAIAQMEGNANFAALYWPQLRQWAHYLKEKGFDPENQLCTDDFAGHLAHNVNLSAKAICALASYAKLCAMRGDQAQAAEFQSLARTFAQRWMKEADDGDHFRLAFDRAGSWSQKYNLVWDRLLGLNLFPAEVARKEMAFYRKTQNRYGLPLDNRKEYTKLDWILWTATLTRDRADFEALVAPVYRFLNETPDRSPMTDWYETVEPKKVGFTARPVVGGVFVELLYDKALWRKYARRDTTKAAGWAPMPALPQITPVVPAADVSPAIWKYTTSRPEAAWVQPRFDDRSWQEGRSGFGSQGTPGAVIGTRWTSREIWLRREFVLPEGSATSNLQGWLHHDEDAEVYINGLLAVSASDFVSGYDAVPLTTSALSTLRTGTNVVAIRCRQTSGGQYIDFGLVRVE